MVFKYCIFVQNSSHPILARADLLIGFVPHDLPMDDQQLAAPALPEPLFSIINLALMS